MRPAERLPDRAFCVSSTQRLHALACRRLTRASLHDAVSEDADALDLELDQVAGLEEAQLLEAAAVADRPRAEELARVQRLRARGVRDAVLELPVHVARIAAAPLLAVDARDHLEPIGIADLVGGHQARAHGVAVVEVLTFARTELPRHLLRLLVARREVVEDGVAEDVLARALFRDVLAAPADVAAKLQLEVQALGIARPRDVGVGAAHREAARVIEDRPLVPDLRDARRRAAQLPHRLEGLAQVLLEAQEVAHLRRHGHRREQPHFVAVERGGARWRLEELRDGVERRLACVDDVQHRFEERRGAVVDAAVSGLQVEHLAIRVYQRAGARWGASHRKRNESHGPLLIIHFAPCTRRRTPCGNSTKTPSPPRSSNGSSAAPRTSAFARSWRAR